MIEPLIDMIDLHIIITCIVAFAQPQIKCKDVIEQASRLPNLILGEHIASEPAQRAV